MPAQRVLIAIDMQNKMERLNSLNRKRENGMLGINKFTNVADKVILSGTPNPGETVDLRPERQRPADALYVIKIACDAPDWMNF